jgi:hypothetical protein
MKAKDLKADNAKAKGQKPKTQSKSQSLYEPVPVERSYNFLYTLSLL